MKMYVLTESFYDYHEGGTTILNAYSDYDKALTALRKEIDGRPFKALGPQRDSLDRRYWCWEYQDRTDVWSYDILEVSLL